MHLNKHKHLRRASREAFGKFRSPIFARSSLQNGAMDRVARTACGFARNIAAFMVGVGFFAVECRAAPPLDIVGTWFTEDGEGGIEILNCGNERCGRIVWMKNPVDKNGRPLTDRNNPDPALRARAICGLTIITGLKPQEDDSWGRGRVYNPDEGRSYDVEIRRTAPDVLNVTGYLALRFLGRTTEWRRTPKNLSRCRLPPSRAGEVKP